MEFQGVSENAPFGVRQDPGEIGSDLSKIGKTNPGARLTPSTRMSVLHPPLLLINWHPCTTATIISR